MSTPESRPDASATADETQTSTRRVDTIWLVGISSILLLTLLPFSSYIASVPFVRDAYLITSLVGLLGILIGFLMARGKHEPDQTVSVDSEQALPQKAGRLDLTVPWTSRLRS